MKRCVLYVLTLFACDTLSAQSGLVFSELMFQPRTDEPEWVELYNDGDAAVHLSDYALARVYADSIGRRYGLPDFQVGAKQYVVLTKDKQALLSARNVPCMDCVVQCAQLPSMPNGGASLALLGADSMIVERLDYSPLMHDRLLRNAAGVSLERRSFSRQVSDVDNWTSASATSNYATPTAANSQQELNVEDDFVVRTLSATVVMNADDGGDKVRFVYENGHHGVHATVVVYDVRGNAVCKLVDNALLGAAGSLEWDGRCSDGTFCNTGRYVVVFSLHDGLLWSKRIRKVVNVLH